MKIKTIVTSIILLGCFGYVNAGININLPSNNEIKSVKYFYAPIKKLATAKSRADRGIVSDSVTIHDNNAVISLPTEFEGYQIGIDITGQNINLFASPDDNINVNISSFQPFNYTLSGSPIADGMNELMLLEAPLYARQMELSANGQPSQTDVEKLQADYSAIQNNFIKDNIDSPAAIIALLNLDGEDYIVAYNNLPESSQKSFLFPLAEQQYKLTQRAIELENKQKSLQSGEVEAPGFTLKNLEGKDVSLSDFRGKWVILDFWGSWCIWCIKGFPELKEAYEKYAGELEIVGIDCNESQEAWRAGVKKYELPWINVYNPENSPLLGEYGVQGFPTKAIIDPEGKIRNITTGHNPDFFVELTKLMGK